jgi:hypothetical protein
MTAAAALALLDALIETAQKLWPVIQDMTRSGLITEEQQSSIHAKYTALKNSDAGQFSGDHWKVV